MIKPEVLSYDDDARVIGYIFDSPLVTRGRVWIPLTQLVTLLIMSREAGRLDPEKSLGKRLKTGSLTMSAILGSEWCHNLAHAALAKQVGKPVDAIRINLGMPLLIYYNSNDPTITPRQHFLRAVGGPLVNGILLGTCRFLRRFTKPGTLARDTVNTAYSANLAILIAGLTPQPWFDGGAMLKWALIARGQNLEEADQSVCEANAAAAAGLGIAAAAAFKRKKKRWGWFFGLLTVLSLATAMGLLKEKA